MVPRGFVRPEDPRYAELKDVMPGRAPRFPELPPDSYILSATNGVLQRVIKGCIEAQVTVRPFQDYFQDC
jgi:hypothetical protein